MKHAKPEAGGPVAVPPASGASISLEHVNKSFYAARLGGEIVALKDVSFAVPDQTFVTLLGPSGCGKSTLLRMVDGLITYDSGTITVLGGPPKPGPEIGFVFQSFRLIPWATAQANVEFGLKALKLTKAERAQRALHHLDLVGLSKFKDAYPGELSGGMKQRVALARSYATEPRLLLMDEPFASIDAQTRELMQIELMRDWSARR
jgi:NitT/TauT family transport system ATP-binding protein